MPDHPADLPASHETVAQSRDIPVRATRIRDTDAVDATLTGAQDRNDYYRSLRDPPPVRPFAEIEAGIRAEARWYVHEEIRLTFQPRGQRGRGKTAPSILNRIRDCRRRHTASIARDRAEAAAWAGAHLQLAAE